MVSWDSQTRSSHSVLGIGRPGAAGRIAILPMQVGAVAIERRAIRADDLVIAAHVKEDMRMILGRPGADAHQLLGRYADGAHASVVVEMGYRIMGHNEPSNSVFERSNLSGAAWLGLASFDHHPTSRRGA
jgi:hypothetical protein